jgi:hypothetical protein
MKNTLKFLGIIVMVVIIGFSMTACGSKCDAAGDCYYTTSNQGAGGMTCGMSGCAAVKEQKAGKSGKCDC